MFNIFSHKGIANQNDAEILAHTSQNGYYPKNKQQQMLVRMWGERYPYTLLVEM
jgi:hypothetical protein